MLTGVYNRVEGGVSVMRPNPGGRLVASFVVDGRTIMPLGTISLDHALAKMSLKRNVTADEIAALAPVWAETEQEFIDRFLLTDIPSDAIDVAVSDDATHPIRDEFRNAWVLAGADVTVDMATARDIWRDKMREARTPLLASLDTDYIRADERGDAAEKAVITNKKKALRDVTADPAIESAMTPEGLREVWPDILGQRP